MYFDNQDTSLYGNAFLFSFGAADQMRRHFASRQKPFFFRAHDWNFDPDTPCDPLISSKPQQRDRVLGDLDTAPW
jgi:hypothetical protein